MVTPSLEKLLRDLLDRGYKMHVMAGTTTRLSEQNSDQNDPLLAWLSDVRSVLYGRTKPEPSVGDLMHPDDLNASSAISDRLTAEEAQALLDTVDVHSMDDDDEENILLAEGNRQLMEAYKKLWKIARRT